MFDSLTTLFNPDFRKFATMPKTVRKQAARRKLIALYRFRPLTWKCMIGYSTLGIAAVLGPLQYGRIRAEQLSTSYGPAMIVRAAWPWYGFTLAALVLFSLLVIFRVRQTRQRVLVFDYGIRVDLPPTRLLRWEHITGIAVAARQRHLFWMPLNTRYQAWIYPTTGNPIHLSPGIENMPSLLTLIKARLYPRLIKELLARFAAGQWLHFGSVSIHPQAFRWQPDRRKLPLTVEWELVKRLDIQSGILVIEFQERRPLRIPVESVPNIELLLQVIQTAIQR